jgi:hypothetical protein
MLIRVYEVTKLTSCEQTESLWTCPQNWYTLLWSVKHNFSSQITRTLSRQVLTLSSSLCQGTISLCASFYHSHSIVTKSPVQEDIRIFFTKLLIFIPYTPKRFFSINISKTVYEFPFRWKTQLAPSCTGR